MQTIAFITETRVFRRMLDSVGLAGDSPTPEPVDINLQADFDVA